MAEYLCIVCPLGCRLKVSRDAQSGEAAVEGASCKRGKEYARQESTAPRRVLTTTVATAWGRPLPVRSAAPIDKARLLAVQRRLARFTLERDVALGETILADIDGQGTALIAAAQS